METKKRSRKKKQDTFEISLPKRDLFRVDEVAQYFGVTDRTIRLWTEHGLLKSEKINGIRRWPREAIINCRFKGVKIGPNL